MQIWDIKCSLVDTFYGAFDFFLQLVRKDEGMKEQEKRQGSL